MVYPMIFQTGVFHGVKIGRALIAQGRTFESREELTAHGLLLDGVMRSCDCFDMQYLNRVIASCSKPDEALEHYQSGVESGIFFAWEGL